MFLRPYVKQILDLPYMLRTIFERGGTGEKVG